jgi:hypothetical protein
VSITTNSPPNIFFSDAELIAQVYARFQQVTSYCGRADISLLA